MATERSRRWTDRDGTDWKVAYDPGVELDTRRDRAFRERVVFTSEEDSVHAPAAFGSDLEALSDADLQGLLDQAREARDEEGSAWDEVRPSG